MISDTRMKDNYRRICAVLAWGTLAAQYIILVTFGKYGGVAATTFTFFGFFTIWSNILVALAFTLPFLKADGKLHLFFQNQAVRAATALYILVVAVVYYSLLYKIHNPQGLSAITNASLHLIMPVLYILDWLFFAKKDKLSYKSLPYWVIFPLAYGVFNIIRGLATGVYPYPFLVIGSRGAVSVMIAMVMFTFTYLIGGAFFIWFGQKISQKNKDKN